MLKITINSWEKFLNLDYFWTWVGMILLLSWSVFLHHIILQFFDFFFKMFCIIVFQLLLNFGHLIFLCILIVYIELYFLRNSLWGIILTICILLIIIRIKINKNFSLFLLFLCFLFLFMFFLHFLWLIFISLFMFMFWWFWMTITAWVLLILYLTVWNWSTACFLLKFILSDIFNFLIVNLNELNLW